MDDCGKIGTYRETPRSCSSWGDPEESESSGFPPSPRNLEVNRSKHCWEPEVPGFLSSQGYDSSMGRTICDGAATLLKFFTRCITVPNANTTKVRNQMKTSVPNKAQI